MNIHTWFILSSCFESVWEVLSQLHTPKFPTKAVFLPVEVGHIELAVAIFACYLKKVENVWYHKIQYVWTYVQVSRGVARGVSECSGNPFLNVLLGN